MVSRIDQLLHPHGFVSNTYERQAYIAFIMLVQISKTISLLLTIAWVI